MYCCARPAARSPPVLRIVRPTTRNASFFPSTISPFYARSPSADFAPLLRLLDDFSTTSIAPAFAQHARQTLQAHGLAPPAAPQARTFNPRFDVREVEGGYELRGEIPGVDAADLQVEFQDAKTLVVKGRRERQEARGVNAPQASVEDAAKTKSVSGTENEAEDASTTPETSAETANTSATAEAVDDDAKSDAGSTFSTSSYQKPSVEDGEEGDAETTASASANANANAVPTPAEPTTSATAETSKQTEQQDPDQQEQQRYNFTERNSASFDRVFRFPVKIDADNVVASLRNGVLNVRIPKVVERPVGVRRIMVQ